MWHLPVLIVPYQVSAWYNTVQTLMHNCDITHKLLKTVCDFPRSKEYSLLKTMLVFLINALRLEQ